MGPDDMTLRLERVPSARPLRALPRVLCYVNHFYGSSPGFGGKSTSQTREVRRAAVMRTLAALRALEAEVTIRVCGVAGQALVPLDVEFQLEDPRLLVYESLVRMCGEREGFDYFINIEDDIEVPRATFRNVLDFDREAMVNECLHPNRLEHEVCVDLQALPGWTLQERRFASHQLRPALNPHSALLLLSRAKLEYALRHVDLGFRGHVVGGPMASAYAHFHKPFTLWRCADDPKFHSVVHLDDWLGPVPPPEAEAFTAVLLSWKRYQNLPAIVASLERIPHIREILLWNNDPERTISIPGVTVFQAPRNFRCLPRYCLVPLASHDNIWFQDDDLLLEPAQFERVLAEYRQDRSRIYGCRGRNLRDGKYVTEDVYGDVDVVLGQTMMFHRSLLSRGLSTLGELPPPTIEDDIAFSLSVPGKHRAVNVEPLRDLGMSDDAALYRRPGHFEKRQAAVDRYLAYAAKPSPSAERIAALEAQCAALEAESRGAREELARLRGSASMRIVEQLRRAPLLYPGYLALKQLVARKG